MAENYDNNDYDEDEEYEDKTDYNEELIRGAKEGNYIFINSKQI